MGTRNDAAQDQARNSPRSLRHRRDARRPRGGADLLDWILTVTSDAIRQAEGPGICLPGPFLAKDLSRTRVAAYLKFGPSEFWFPHQHAPLCRVGGLGAPPRRGRFLTQDWYFSGAAPIFSRCPQPSLWIAEDSRCCALQADGETRSAVTVSSIRRRSAAWIILPDWTYRSRRRVSAL
jgi:hypothetical protein